MQVPLSVKLRGVPSEPYQVNPDEKETYKLIHQLEFNSFREQALLSAKQNSNQYEDDYYYEEVPQNVFESN